MKFITGLLYPVLLLALSCSPKNDEVSTEHVNPGGTATDSVLKPRKDGTATSQTHETPTLPLPQPVLQLLSRKYPGWQEPVLQETPDQQATDKSQGPLMVRADFNGDTLQDIALQIRHKRNVVVVALLQQENGWQLHELTEDILFNNRGTYKSLHYVYLTEAGSRVFSRTDRDYITTEHDAVSVGIDNRATVYMYKNGRFNAYESGD